MGGSISSEKTTVKNEDEGGGVLPRVHAEEGIANPESETEGTARILEDSQFNKARVRELCFALQRIARLQRETTSASIEASQKHREATSKRQEVWVADGKFMQEVQRLSAKGALVILGDLSQLATECQISRNLLGPVEQESIEAEQRWEGLIWRLRHAEDNLYAEFKDEFETAEQASTASPSVASSPYRSSSDVESRSSTQNIFEIEPHRSFQAAASVASTSSFPRVFDGTVVYSDPDQAINKQSNLMGLDRVETDELTSHEYEIELGSGIVDIDGTLTQSPPPSSLGQEIPLPEGEHVSNLNLLLTDFSSIRERVDKWIEHTMLSSRLEAMSLVDILRAKFEKEDKRIPSNWAQLTIAYWELRGYPDSRQESASQNTPDGDENGDTSMPTGTVNHEPPISSLHPPDPPSYVQAADKQNLRASHSDPTANSTSLGPGAISPFSGSTVIGSPRLLLHPQHSFDSFQYLHKGAQEHKPP